MKEDCVEDNPRTKGITCAAWKCQETVYGMGVCKTHFDEWDMESITQSGALGETNRERQNRRV